MNDKLHSLREVFCKKVLENSAKIKQNIPIEYKVNEHSKDFLHSNCFLKILSNDFVSIKYLHNKKSDYFVAESNISFKRRHIASPARNMLK